MDIPDNPDSYFWPGHKSDAISEGLTSVLTADYEEQGQEAEALAESQVISQKSNASTWEQQQKGTQNADIKEVNSLLRYILQNDHMSSFTYIDPLTGITIRDWFQEYGFMPGASQTALIASYWIDIPASVKQALLKNAPDVYREILADL